MKNKEKQEIIKLFQFYTDADREDFLTFSGIKAPNGKTIIVNQRGGSMTTVLSIIEAKFLRIFFRNSTRDILFEHSNAVMAVWEDEELYNNPAEMLICLFDQIYSRYVKEDGEDYTELFRNILNKPN